ncbi:hypothetical protein [uncultured Tateyamaria sp.]|uniref:hypothetical protein n=1 Tax=uncultured Tateyamaria sp. TaxID=455651 RepID=UPI0026163857|nr:hypothetical protein [uncultured Tateyamaria sp.]
MTPEEIEALFTRESGVYAFARWDRPLAPVVFGVEDETLGVIKGAIEAVCQLAGTSVAETDPELGANFIWFFLTEWSELLDVPNMDRLVPDLAPLVDRLKQAQANQYRTFRFDEAGAIKACFVFLRMDENLREVPAETLALSQVVQSMLLWSDLAFRDRSALAVAGETTVLRPDIAALIRAAYDHVMPVAANDPSHALRLSARIGTVQ